MRAAIPRLVIAGLSGDSGKTMVCLSLVAALRRHGLGVAVFKKGPDYIDSAWLSLVAGRNCYNLDTFMVEQQLVYKSFIRRATGSDIAIVEGNRGIFDGRDENGANSTAELAKLLRAPVILLVNAAKSTRTIAAIVKGCLNFDPDVDIRGIILNNVAGERHRKVIEESIARYCDIPVVGVIPAKAMGQCLIPQRHLGLIPPTEYEKLDSIESTAAEIAENHLRIDQLQIIAESAAPLEYDEIEMEGASDTEPTVKAKIGYFSDSAFTFYYPESLEALRGHGAELIPISPLVQRTLPDIDGLYMGGGFPETHSEKLASNRPMLEAVKKAASNGMPIYAECGGLIYLSASLEADGCRYPMSAVFDLHLKLGKKPAGHGYVLAEIDKPNPFFEKGTLIKGHEFHYTSPVEFASERFYTCFKLQTGAGISDGRDGLAFKNTLAGYLHIHSDGVKTWAPAFVKRATEYKNNSASNSNGRNDNSSKLNRALL